MTPLSVFYVATAAICFAAALQQVVMALRGENRKLHFLLAIAAFAVAADAVFELRVLASTTAEHYLAGMPWTALTSATAVVALSWYMALRTGAARRWLLWVLSVSGVVTVVLDFAVGLAYRGPVELTVSILPWGEQIVHISGATNPLRLIGDLFMVGFLFFLLDITIRMARRRGRRQAWFLGGSFAAYALGLLTIIPADLGWFLLPSPRTPAFLLIVAAMSWELSGHLVQAAKLSDEVRVNERRWRQLIDNVHLLVARIDRNGHLVAFNPYFKEVLGYKSKDVIGKNYWKLIAPEHRDDRRTAFLLAMEGEVTPEVEVCTLTAAGERRRIVWRDVVLKDSEQNIEGMLSFGADLTKKFQAEAARDNALKELEILKVRLEEENVYLREEIRTVHGFENIIGGSDALLYVLHKVRQVAPSDTSVLILGETGVGKELIARTIHSESPRSHAPFVVVNCAALPANLIESELFGHERGAFTGAERQRRGRFELADGGTLFLDEIGELPLELQPKLLRVLQEGQIERLGGSEVIETDVRVIAATNRDLAADITTGGFREDLFYRIAVYPITVPPLRDRREDIPVMVQHFAQRFAQHRGNRINEVPAEVMRRLQAYDWPGNVRELQNVIERAVLTSTDGVLRLAEPLKSNLNGKAESGSGGIEIPGLTLDEVERRYIVQVLEAKQGQVSGADGAAEILGLHANTLRYRMKKLGITVGRKNGTVTVES